LVGNMRFLKGKYYKKSDLHKLNPDPSLRLEDFVRSIC